MSYLQRYYSESRKADHMTKVQDQLDELKGIMVKNIGQQKTHYTNQTH